MLGLALKTINYLGFIYFTILFRDDLNLYKFPQEYDTLFSGLPVEAVNVVLKAIFGTLTPDDTRDGNISEFQEDFKDLIYNSF